MEGLTLQEQYIIEVLREARPHESILIVKDQLGRIDNYLITRTQKVVVNKVSIEAVKMR